MVALNGGKPELMTLIDMLTVFVAFREEVVTPAHQIPAPQGARRAHVLVGLAIAVANIDEVIRSSAPRPTRRPRATQLM